MKLALASDIHTEISGQKDLGLQEQVDVLVLAGDIGKGVQAIEYAKKFLEHAHDVVIIFGNHEFWRGSSYQKTLASAREYAANVDRIHFLESDSVQLHGYTFIGATAWTDYSVGNFNQFTNMFDAERYMNDFRLIKWQDGPVYRKVRANDFLKINQMTRHYIFNTLRNSDPEKCIVVTHHAPTPLSINHKYHADRLNHCYANDWRHDIMEVGPKLWIHGHMHDACDYVWENTRVVCNPIGYPDEIADSEIVVIDV